MVIDTRSGRIRHSAETDNDLKSRHPYKEWMKNVKRLVPFEDLPDDQVGSPPRLDDAQLKPIRNSSAGRKSWIGVIRVLGEIGQRGHRFRGRRYPRSPCSSTGQRIVTTIFRQRFAGVTNPPIDPREARHVAGHQHRPRMNVFCETEGQAHRLGFKCRSCCTPISNSSTLEGRNTNAPRPSILTFADPPAAGSGQNHSRPVRRSGT